MPEPPPTSARCKLGAESHLQREVSRGVSLVEKGGNIRPETIC